MFIKLIFLNPIFGSKLKKKAFRSVNNIAKKIRYSGTISASKRLNPRYTETELFGMCTEPNRTQTNYIFFVSQLTSITF